MRILFYYIIQSILIFIILYAAILPTLLLDVPWGSSKNDGLFLLVIPIYLLPLTLFFSLIKVFLIKRKVKERKYRRSAIYPIMMLLLDTGVASSASLFGVIFSITLSLVLSAYIVSEMATVRKFWGNQIKVDRIA
jgi:hypothetical protein